MQNSFLDSKYLLASAIFLGFIFASIASYQSKDKLCIDSQLINSVIWNGQNIPNCSSGQSAQWSKELIAVTGKINDLLHPLNTYKVDRPVTLEFTSTGSSPRSKNYVHFNHTDLQSHSIPLEVIKFWIKSENSHVTEFPLLFNTLSHFQFFLIYGYSPQVQIQRSQAPVLWTANQTNSHPNCISRWSLTQSWDLCLNRSYQLFETQSEFLNERLFSKLLQTWIAAYQKLNLGEKYEIQRFIRNRIQVYRSQIKTNEPVSFAKLNREMSRFWLTNDYFPQLAAQRIFFGAVLKELESLNFSHVVENSKFHLVYFKDKVNLARWQSDLKISKSKSNLVALSNGKDLSVYPLNKLIRLNSFSKWSADQIVIETCQPLKMKDVLFYSNKTEKLLVIYNCENLDPKKLNIILEKGIYEYAKNNSEELFVHFHLPSLVSKRDKLDGNLEIFQFLTQRNRHNSIYELFGWRELNWDHITKTYHPKAIVDAVEIFRTEL